MCAFVLNATMGDDEDPARPLLLLLSAAFIAAIVSGLVAAVNVAIAVFRWRERSRLLVAVLGLSLLLVPAVIFCIVADILGGTHEGSEVIARIEGGRIELLRRQGQQDRHISEVNGPFHLVLRIENRDAEAQRVAITELLAFDGQHQPAPKLGPNAWPTIDGRVRHFSFLDEGGTVIWTSGGWSMAVARGVDPQSRPLTLPLMSDRVRRSPWSYAMTTFLRVPLSSCSRTSRAALSQGSARSLRYARIAQPPAEKPRLASTIRPPCGLHLARCGCTLPVRVPRWGSLAVSQIRAYHTTLCGVGCAHL